MNMRKVIRSRLVRMGVTAGVLAAGAASLIASPAFGATGGAVYNGAYVYTGTGATAQAYNLGYGCMAIVGDYPNGYGTGAAEIHCPATEIVSMKVYLDRSLSPSGAGAVSVSANVSGATYYDNANTWDTWITGPSVCGGVPRTGPRPEVSINGGPYTTWLTSKVSATTGTIWSSFTPSSC